MASKPFHTYFKNLNALLVDAAVFGGSAGQEPDSSKNREILVTSTLKWHLPQRALVVQGGIITDSRDTVSHQADVVVCNQFSFMGGALDYGIIPVEAVVAAIEVKTTAHRPAVQKAFKQLDLIKQLEKNIEKSRYDDSEESLGLRTRRALTIAWFWKGSVDIKRAANWLCDPTRLMKGVSGYADNQPNAVYVHDQYLLIVDPDPAQASITKGTGKPNPFLIEFKDVASVLRRAPFQGTRGMRVVYYFEKKANWLPLEVLVMWLSNEVNRYLWELPKASAYVTRP